MLAAQVTLLVVVAVAFASPLEFESETVRSRSAVEAARVAARMRWAGRAIGSRKARGDPKVSPYGYSVLRRRWRCDPPADGGLVFPLGTVGRSWSDFLPVGASRPGI